MKKILISACLAGDLVRYDGKRAPLNDALLNRLERKGMLVKICPEVAGGLKTPRSEAQIVKGNGRDVLEGRAKVMDIEGHDVTLFFVAGARHALCQVKKHKIEIAILKEKSPSCGVRHIYNGAFDSTLIPGIGVTAAILEQNGIRVFSENELDQLKIFLSAREYSIPYL